MTDFFENLAYDSRTKYKLSELVNEKTIDYLLSNKAAVFVKAWRGLHNDGKINKLIQKSKPLPAGLNHFNVMPIFEYIASTKILSSLRKKDRPYYDALKKEISTRKGDAIIDLEGIGRRLSVNFSDLENSLKDYFNQVRPYLPSTQYKLLPEHKEEYLRLKSES